MPLIKCPMCEKMISPNAISCPNCGEPMKEGIENTIENNIINKNHCSLILIETGKRKIEIIKRIREVTDCGLAEAKNSTDNTPSIILNDITLSKAESIIKSFEALGAKMQISSVDDIKNLEKVKSDVKTKSKIICPNCKLDKVHKISGLSKAGSAVLFGVFSLGKLNKTYECNNCGYRW